MRLIDADKLHYSRIRIVHADGIIGGYNAVVMSAEIKDAPTVDAVEVVRCGECIHNYANMIPGGEGCAKCTELPITPDFYCKNGERKGGDE